MPAKHRMSKRQRPFYTAGEGPVRYMDGSDLSRPLELPQGEYKTLKIILWVAVGIGVALIIAFLFMTVFGVVNRHASITNIIETSEVNAPALSSIALLDNQGIVGQLNEQGYLTYDDTSDEDALAGSLDLYKLPSGVDPLDAAAVYSSGMNNVSGETAARYLAGSWHLLVNREAGTDMRVRYADFDSGTAQQAITNAMTAQGFSEEGASEIGTDSAGNIVRSGTVQVGDETCYWTISVCPLAQIYQNNGLPEDAQYVGVLISRS